jgi:hypothetical protein
MSDDRTRATVRLPDDAYDQLCAELPSFSTDTARFQFLVQFYLDHQQARYLLLRQAQCASPADTDAGPYPTANGEETPCSDGHYSESPSNTMNWTDGGADND